MPSCAVPYRAVPWRIVLCCATPCPTGLCRSLPYCFLPFCALVCVFYRSVFCPSVSNCVVLVSVSYRVLPLYIVMYLAVICPAMPFWYPAVPFLPYCAMLCGWQCRQGVARGRGGAQEGGRRCRGGQAKKGRLRKGSRQWCGTGRGGRGRGRRSVSVADALPYSIFVPQLKGFHRLHSCTGTGCFVLLWCSSGWCTFWKNDEFCVYGVAFVCCSALSVVKCLGYKSSLSYAFVCLPSLFFSLWCFY